MLRKSLTREGFSVEVVGNGPDGLFEAGEHAYDAVSYTHLDVYKRQS